MQSLPAPVSPRYRILGKVGEGRTSEVFRALDGRLKRVVALKVLREPFREQEAFARELEVEARAMARMTHPNVVRVYDFDRAGGRSYMVMEYVRGRTLKAHLSQQVSPAEEETRRLAEQLREGLSAVRRADITHTRVLLADILVDDAGTVKITGIGANKAVGAEEIEVTRMPSPDSQHSTPESTCGGDPNVVDLVTRGLLPGILLSEPEHWLDAPALGINAVARTSPRDSMGWYSDARYALSAPVGRGLAAARVSMGGIDLTVAIPVARADASGADTVWFAAISTPQPGTVKPNRYARPGRLAMSLLAQLLSLSYWSA